MEQLSSFLVASVLLTLSPGPDLLMVIAKSLAKGSRSGLLFTAGLITGLCLHTALLILGWAQFIGERPGVVLGIKMLGCAYFVYLGLLSIYKHFKERKEIAFEVNANKSDFKEGLYMNLLNPKVSLFFWLFFPGFLFSEAWSIAQQYALLGGLFLLQAGVIFTFVILFSIQFKHFFSRFRLDLISGLIWIILGIYLVVT